MDLKSDDKKRLFLAISAPEPIKIAARQLEEEMAALPGVRWIPRENLHITQFFLGNVDMQILPNLTEMLRISLREMPAFTLVFDQFCYAPKARNPRMIWARYHKAEAFKNLHERISDLFSQINPALQQRKSPTPHITLARLKQVASKITYPILPHLVLNNQIDIGELALWSSDLQASGAIYRQEAVFSLSPLFT